MLTLITRLLVVSTAVSQVRQYLLHAIHSQYSSKYFNSFVLNSIKLLRVVLQYVLVCILRYSAAMLVKQILLHFVITITRLTADDCQTA